MGSCKNIASNYIFKKEMPQLNCDLLREVFYEIVKQDESFDNIEKFMMAGKEPFKLVLDCCKKANDGVIFHDKIVAKFPRIEYKPPPPADNRVGNHKEHVMGTQLSTSMILFKPISRVLASTIKSLDIRSLSTALIPMLKAIDWEIKELYVSCGNLKASCAACSNIANVQTGVTLKVCDTKQFCYEMKGFSFRCEKLTILGVDFNEIYKAVIGKNSALHNIRDLTIEGSFRKTDAFHEELKQFAAFLLSTFPNMKTLNIKFVSKGDSKAWNWNDQSMAEIFQQLLPGINGCISFKLIFPFHFLLNVAHFPDVQRDGNEYYKIFQVTDTLSFKMASADMPAIAFLNLMPLLFSPGLIVPATAFVHFDLP